MTRSPEAHRKLMEQRNLSSSKARRNLSLSKTSKVTSSTNNEGDTNRRSKRCIDMTTDDTGGTPEQETVDSEQNKDASQGDSQPTNWFSSPRF